MGTTTVYLTRHGQTEWNVQQKMQGHQDSALTPLGVQQAQWLSRGLRDVQLNAVYASSSPRTLRTSELILGDRKVPLTACDEFKELCMGSWEGLESPAIESSDPEQYRYFWNDPAKFSVEGSETFAAVQERALNKLLELVGKHEGQSLMIVTHTVVIKVLMAYFEGRSMDKLWELSYIYPTCLCRVDITDGVPEIVLHGDISHYEVSGAGMES